MKKLFLSVVMILVLALTACNASNTGTPTGSTSSTSLPIAAELAVGTLKLSGTDQDITIDQAKELFVYWEVYEELSQSETAAQAEVDGLIAQIQETMTGDQMQAITAMNISQQDVFASMQGVAITTSNSSDSTVSVPSGSSNGGMPAGGPPSDGGGAPPDGGGTGGDMGGAAPASDTGQSAGTSAGSSIGTGVPTALVEAVIQALQEKIAA